MDKKLLLNDSLHFLGLGPGFTESELKESYHKLAKKYHPDSGEFTSDVMFVELNKHYESLKDHLLIHPEEETFSFGSGEASDPKIQTSKPSKDPVFHEYKMAKEKETEAILRYYEKRNLHPIELSENLNKELIQLRKDLEPVLSVYVEILKNHSTSLWANDAKDSLERLRVWLR
ncbi:J domain-containing protein [Leptospira kanakyensis]|uniref:Molecular chaperone DnaJ n=1 Tax=Leptospira kanakyensis TaxID=2484968 RepID=A0A6N4QLZ3_9LEPT|nr:J domain-containing protein [Leptospira kanakyensis]MCW7481568.1 J domain-containing protein [Leptospira kanakyensis]TGK53894.1 molecular chaperone DnaJ [Leptospira kanakyensis]TGK57689.1 molecular chaperone DnaJ [Leptospira kanakyensis]TGK73399.1 molecular chaperone DnaJ [Leptospira kanakyensis]